MVISDEDEEYLSGPKPFPSGPLELTVWRANAFQAAERFHSSSSTGIPVISRRGTTGIVHGMACDELSCYAALGWQFPPFVLDLLAEYRQLKNGVLPKDLKRDLASVMARHRLLWIDPANKEEMQVKVMAPGGTPGPAPVWRWWRR
jgi:hypothetical protein